MTHSITTLSIGFVILLWVALFITMLSVFMLRVAILNVNQANYAECHYAECRSTECRGVAEHPNNSSSFDRSGKNWSVRSFFYSKEKPFYFDI
jgi:hypothetical protein